MIQFYAPDLRENPILSPEESVHCARVLRKKEGDIIYVTDGEGNRFECSITKASTKGVEFEVIGELPVPKAWDCFITLAVAPTKNADRMAWFVEKATEIGVDNIVFLNCRYNERKAVNLDRLRRNAISAMNQSLKTRLPQLEGPVALEEFAKREFSGQKFFGYCDAETERRSLARELRQGEDACILIGPEGDFSREEVSALTENGFLPSIFINTRLRTETAALFGLQTVHIINELHG